MYALLIRSLPPAASLGSLSRSSALLPACLASRRAICPSTLSSCHSTIPFGTFPALHVQRSQLVFNRQAVRSFSSSTAARASTEGESAPESRPDYYRILGVERAALPDEIKTSFRELAKKYHPDVVAASAGRSVTEAEVDFFKLLNEAYTVLSDPATRAEYDSERYSRRELLRRRNEGPGVSGSVVGGRIVSFGRTSGRALTAEELDTMSPEEAFQKGVQRAQERAREHAKFRGAMARANRVPVDLPTTHETIMRQVRPVLFVIVVWVVALGLFGVLFTK